MIPTEEIQQKLDELDRLKERGCLTADAALVIAARAAELVIEHHANDGGYLREAVQLICEIAINQDQQIARAGITALFPLLVERLNDSFDPANCRLYDQLFIQVIEFCRRLPAGQRLPAGNRLDAGLKQFGLMNETDLLARKAGISNLKSQIPNPASFKLIKRVLLLSRVTIGADVVVTSAIIAKLRATLPQAEFVILGSGKLRELYGGDARIRIREVTYERGGSLISRLTSWLAVVEAVNEERDGLDENEFWVIDPDSRLTQLGLLPLVENDRNYYFFESRSYQGDSKSTSIGQLAAHWIGKIMGNLDPVFPFVALPIECQKFGQAVTKAIRNPQSAIRNLVAISFGVGGNHGKRVSDEFEERLVHHLLADSKLILDKGASADERELINRIVAGIRRQGRRVVEINDANKTELADEDLRQADVVTWDGSIGAFAGLIAASDEYIGYDSAGQHIAAALGVPALTVFVNSGNATFAERWRPFGKLKAEVVNVEAAELANSPNFTNDVLMRTCSLHRKINADNAVAPKRD
ncbi:MAG: hypothetical protein M3X11_05715 [Acidobacteriota bacterium]|nr:hypothetical protein [Acidobacteriota bacterium]